MYQAVLLDVYGTLVRDDGVWESEMAALVAELSGAAADVVAGEWDQRIWAMADSAHGDDFRTLADLEINSLQETAKHFGVRVTAAQTTRQPALPPLFADAGPFLSAARVPVCLVSDADRDVLHRLLEHHGIAVAGVVTSEDARAYKPRPEPFLLALQHLGLTSRDVIHVGDSPVADLMGAGQLGIDTAFVQRGSRRLPEHIRATHAVATLTDLMPTLGFGRTE